MREFIREKLRERLFEDTNNIVSGDVINDFRNIGPGDIEFESDVDPGHMQLTVKFADDELQEKFSELMMNEFDESYTIVDLEINNMNHIHINAIPSILQGIGIGKAIYRKVLEEFDFITTGFSYARISEEAKGVWKSLMKSDDYYYFIGKDYNLVTLAKKETHPIIYKTILDEYGDDLQSTNFDPNEVDDWHEH